MWASLICRTLDLEGTIQIPCRPVGEIIAVCSTQYGVRVGFGLHRGCPSSLVWDFPGRDLKTQPRCGEFFSLGTLRNSSLIFADDVVLLASLLCDLQNALGHCHHDPINEKIMDGWMDGSSEFLVKDGYFQQEMLYL